MKDKDFLPRMIAALRQVPEKKLLLFDFIRSVPVAGNELDADVLVDRQPEVNLAIAEIESYTRQTQACIETLKRLP